MNGSAMRALRIMRTEADQRGSIVSAHQRYPYCMRKLGSLLGVVLAACAPSPLLDGGETGADATVSDSSDDGALDVQITLSPLHCGRPSPLCHFVGADVVTVTTDIGNTSVVFGAVADDGGALVGFVNIAAPADLDGDVDTFRTSLVDWSTSPVVVVAPGGWAPGIGASFAGTPTRRALVLSSWGYTAFYDLANDGLPLRAPVLPEGLQSYTSELRATTTGYVSDWLADYGGPFPLQHLFLDAYGATAQLSDAVGLHVAGGDVDDNDVAFDLDGLPFDTAVFLRLSTAASPQIRSIPLAMPAGGPVAFTGIERVVDGFVILGGPRVGDGPGAFATLAVALDGTIRGAWTPVPSGRTNVDHARLVRSGCDLMLLWADGPVRGIEHLTDRGEPVGDAEQYPAIDGADPVVSPTGYAIFGTGSGMGSVPAPIVAVALGCAR